MLQSLNGVRVHKAPTAPHLTRRRPTLPLTRTFSFALDFLLEFYFILFYFIVDEVQNYKTTITIRPFQQQLPRRAVARYV